MYHHYERQRVVDQRLVGHVVPIRMLPVIGLAVALERYIPGGLLVGAVKG